VRAEDVREVKGVVAKKNVFDAVKGPDAPLALRSAKEAAAHFEAGELAKLVKRVDFEREIVLVFAWQGLPADRVTFEVGESAPPRVDFTVHRGNVKDSAPRVAIFAIPREAKWFVK
jgi:hypothetical protein